MSRFVAMGVTVVVLLSAPAAFAGDPAPSAEERTFAALLNEQRRQAGLAPVQISPVLTDIASDYASANRGRGGIDHQYDPPFTQRAQSAGCSKWLGPVLAYDHDDARAVLASWLSSSGHRAVLMDPEVTHLGAGFDGPSMLAYAMPCTGAAHNSGDFGAVSAGGSPPPSGPPQPPVLPQPPVRGTASSIDIRNLTRRGRRVTAAVALTGTQPAKATFLLRRYGRSGRAVRVRRTVNLTPRTRTQRVGVTLPSRGRWTVSLAVVASTVRASRTATFSVRR